MNRQRNITHLSIAGTSREMSSRVIFHVYCELVSSVYCCKLSSYRITEHLKKFDLCVLV